MTSLKNFYFLALIIAVPSQLLAQEVIDIWQGQDMPYFKESDLEEREDSCWDVPCLYDITKPSLTVYKAKGENTGKAVIVIPGGGYEIVAIKHEGHDVAKAFAEQGITAAVLKYRIPNPKSSTLPEMTPLSDLRQSISFLRKNTKKYGINTNKVGVAGFSAGGHLATVAGLWEPEDKTQKPDFSVLIYGVSRLDKTNEEWLEERLYYRKMTEEEKQQQTLYKIVDKNTPPAFLVHSMDDEVCLYLESTLYAEALTKAGVEAETHLYAKGGHGFGLGRAGTGTTQWLDLAASWIKRL